MSVISCCASNLATLSRAAAKAARARLREWQVGRVAADWAQRAQLCERCPLRVIQHNISYCGRPLLDQIHRDPSAEGCGCPTTAKARSPDEHCPLDGRNRPATRAAGHCTCKWCALRVLPSARAA